MELSIRKLLNDLDKLNGLWGDCSITIAEQQKEITKQIVK